MSRWTAIFLAGSLAMLTTFVGMAHAQDGYRLRSGDTLTVEVLEDPALNRTLLIAPDGRVTMPLAGAVVAAGRTLEAVQSDLASKLTPNFTTSPTVYLALQSQFVSVPSAVGPAALMSVFVMGEAASPGRLDLTPGATVLQAFAQMGGFSKFAATKRVQLRRGAKIYNLNYADIESGKSNAGNTVLSDGDVIVIPQRKLFE